MRSVRSRSSAQRLDNPEQMVRRRRFNPVPTHRTKKPIKSQTRRLAPDRTTVELAIAATVLGIVIAGVASQRERGEDGHTRAERRERDWYTDDDDRRVRSASSRP